MNELPLTEAVLRLIKERFYGQHPPIYAVRFVIEVSGIGARSYSASRVAEETCQALNFLSIKVQGDDVRFRVVEPNEL